MAVWLQVKVSGRGLGMHNCTLALSVTQKRRCSCAICKCYNTFAAAYCLSYDDRLILRLRNDLYCVERGVKLYSLTWCCRAISITKWVDCCNNTLSENNMNTHTTQKHGQRRLQLSMWKKIKYTQVITGVPRIWQRMTFDPWIFQKRVRKGGSGRKTPQWDPAVQKRQQTVKLVCNC